MSNKPVLALANTPKHVAFIMDGNLRWGEQNGVSAEEALRAGAENIERIVERAAEYGIEHVTFWALSVNNWTKRGKAFTNTIMNLFREFLSREKMFERLIRKGGKLHVFGDISVFPQDIQDGLNAHMAQDPKEKNIDINIALNYGGRVEIVNAVKQVVDEGLEISEVTLASKMYGAGQPDADLIVRTSGEIRTSGFLLWGSEYSELYFTEEFWPAFSSDSLDKALAEFSNRERRFGGLSTKKKSYETS